MTNSREASGGIRRQTRPRISAAGGGDRRISRRKFSRASSPPKASIVTPRESLETRPPMPFSRARRQIQGRNPTPWTVPRISIRRPASFTLTVTLGAAPDAGLGADASIWRRMRGERSADCSDRQPPRFRGGGGGGGGPGGGVPRTAGRAAEREMPSFGAAFSHQLADRAAAARRDLLPDSSCDKSANHASMPAPVRAEVTSQRPAGLSVATCRRTASRSKST